MLDLFFLLLCFRFVHASFEGSLVVSQMYTEDIFGAKTLTITIDSITIMTHWTAMAYYYCVFVLAFLTFDPNAWKLMSAKLNQYIIIMNFKNSTNIHPYLFYLLIRVYHIHTLQLFLLFSTHALGGRKIFSPLCACTRFRHIVSTRRLAKTIAGAQVKDIYLLFNKWLPIEIAQARKIRRR